jgi:hypothetical protein
MTKISSGRAHYDQLSTPPYRESYFSSEDIGTLLPPTQRGLEWYVEVSRRPGGELKVRPLPGDHVPLTSHLSWRRTSSSAHRRA